MTLELDQTTHLPLARTFEWRNEQFKDHDEDREEYDDYHSFNGLPTPLTLTRSRNGDMVNQRFLTKVEYNLPLPPDTFNPERDPQKEVAGNYASSGGREGPRTGPARTLAVTPA